MAQPTTRSCNLSLVMRKMAFCICENKDADQHAVTAKLISAFVFATRIEQSFYFLNFKPLVIFCGCTARFVSDLVGNPEDRFSHNEAHLMPSAGAISQLAMVAYKNCVVRKHAFYL